MVSESSSAVCRVAQRSWTLEECFAEIFVSIRPP